MPDTPRRDEDATIKSPSGAPPARPSIPALDLSALPREWPSPRYEKIEVLGRGGMGEVWACRDAHVGRLVAVKRVRADNAATSGDLGRFLREARVQGQLEHPAIVPLHDLGIDDDGPYFTMRRVVGHTLAEILRALSRGDQAVARAFSRRQLLSAFARACLAVDFAHARGVVHRDLKPSNIMLGDFGEVYVLDWGVAKVVGVADPVVPIEHSFSSPASSTTKGRVLGTRAYMAPEQLRGEVETVSARADVYALGAILFEILTLRRFRSATVEARPAADADVPSEPQLASTPPEQDPPPELLAACTRATARLPEERFASARELHDQVERFLDGDRNLELRRALSEQHAKTAAESCARAIAHGASFDDRRQALREVGRALALDPDNTEALRTFVRLLAEPPRDLPEEARAGVERSASKLLADLAPVSTVAYAIMLCFVPIVLLMGVRDWRAFFVSSALNVVNLVTFAVISRLRARTNRRLVGPAVAVSMLFLGSLTVLFGPFVVLPTAAAINAMAFVLQSGARRSVYILAAFTVPIVVPVLLEWSGILPPAYAFEGAGLRILPWVTRFPEAPTTVFLLLASVGGVAIGCVFAARFRIALWDAQRRLHLYAWQLAQLLPADRAAVDRLGPTRPSSF